MIPIPPKLLVYGAAALALAVAVGTIYGCGRKAQSDATALKVARQTIKVERQALKITNQIDMRVNAEGIQTATKAQEATREIERIRTARNRAGSAVDGATLPVAGGEVRAGQVVGQVGGASTVGLDDPAAASVMQLAREARAAAVESSAKLQPARAGSR